MDINRSDTGWVLFYVAAIFIVIIIRIANNRQQITEEKLKNCIDSKPERIERQIDSLNKLIKTR